MTGPDSFHDACLRYLHAVNDIHHYVTFIIIKGDKQRITQCHKVSRCCSSF